MRTDKPRLLFICTNNAGRSQIAEALARNIAGDSMEIMSAGVDPWPNCHPVAVALMKEQGIDISGQHPKHVRDFANDDFDLVVTIGDRAKIESPAFNPRTGLVHWDIGDPATADGTGEIKHVFQKTLQEIAKRLPTLFAMLSNHAWGK